MESWKFVQPSDTGVLASFYRSLESPLADLNAEMMVAWREILNLRYRIVNGILLMLGDYEGRTVLWGPPLGGHLSADHIELALDLSIASGGEPVITYLWHEYPLWSALQNKREYSIQSQAHEYRYSSRAIADLQERVLRKKRALANSFYRDYCPDVLVYRSTETQANECLELLDRWTARKRKIIQLSALDKHNLEIRACESALRDRLDLKGVVVKIADRIEAFSLGSLHGRATFNCMFEKANVELRGVYAFVFQALARHVSNYCEEINSGEDWGIDYLSNSKRHWKPQRIEPSYTLRRVDHA